MLGMSELRRDDEQVVRRARRLERFLTQPLFTTESFTGQPGQYVALEDTLAGCEAILAGEFDSVDERRLYMIGAAKKVGCTPVSTGHQGRCDHSASLACTTDSED